MNYINKSEKINVTKEMIWELINNVDNYEKILRWCSRSTIISDEKNLTLVNPKLMSKYLDPIFTIKIIMAKK